MDSRPPEPGMPSNTERHDAVRLQLERFRARAEHNARKQQFGQMAYAYPGSLGEWLGTAVQIAASVSWQAHWTLRPLERHDAHERAIAEQGRSFIESYGAVLVGALAACDATLDQDLDTDVEVELPAVDSVLQVWDEARDERDALVFSLTALGDAIWIYGTCRDRDAPLLPTLATKLLEAVGYAALALAVADEL
jgi:hypothetical protein